VLCCVLLLLHAQIMFGPDICGQLNARTHVIFHSEAKDDNLLVKHDVRVEKDNLTHVYTLHVKVNIAAAQYTYLFLKSLSRSPSAVTCVYAASMMICELPPMRSVYCFIEVLSV
jgi:Calreticulin family